MLRSLIVPIYMPAFVATLALALVIPVLPTYMKHDLLADEAAIGTVISMQGLGSFLSGALNGMLISRMGERNGMISGSALRAFAYGVCAVVATATFSGSLDEYGSDQANDPAVDSWLLGWSTVLAAARFGSGVGMSLFQISRQSWVAATVPKHRRGRANGLIGGVGRLAQTLGPAMGGIIVHVSGAPAAFSTQTALGLLVIGMIAVGVPRGGPAGSTSGGVSANRGAGTTRASDGGVASEGGDGGVDGGASCLPAWMWSLVRVAPVRFSF